MKLSDLRYSRLQVFVSGQSNVSYRQKNQVLGTDFSEGRNHFETFQGGLGCGLAVETFLENKSEMCLFSPFVLMSV